MKTIYECSHCGLQSEDLEQIDLCEKGHQTASDAKVVETSKYVVGEPLPDTITVEFANGSKVIYEYSADVDLIKIGGTE